MLCGTSFDDLAFAAAEASNVIGIMSSNAQDDAAGHDAPREPG